MEFLQPLEAIEPHIETDTAVPPNLGFVQLAGVNGTARPTDASGRANPELKEAAHLWKDMNRDVMDSNMFRRALHAPKDTYEPYNPPAADEDAADFGDRPVAAGFKPEKPKTATFNVYDVEHRGFQHGIKSNHYDDDFHPDYATGFGGAQLANGGKGVNYRTSAQDAARDEVRAQAKQLEKQDVAAKDAQVAAKATKPDSEKATPRQEIKEEKKEEKKAALFQRVALSQGTPLPEGYNARKEGIVRPNDASG